VIRIARAALPTDLDHRLTALTADIAKAALDQRAAEARKLWRRKSTREQVHHRLDGVLRQMAPGLERCMYCGDNQGTDIDHFEPLTRNPLRTFDWLNHLLACALCNSHNKRDRFPVDGDGQPLLIDPTVEDPFDHLSLTLSLGRYVSLSAKGRATIEVCDLNRADPAARPGQLAHECGVLPAPLDRSTVQRRSHGDDKNHSDCPGTAVCGRVPGNAPPGGWPECGNRLLRDSSSPRRPAPARATDRATALTAGTGLGSRAR
jgi:hypothetical protein